MASLSGNNRIVLKATYGEGGNQHEEGIAAAASVPGMNVVMTDAVQVMERHTYTPGATLPGANIASPIKVVKEDLLRGRTINDAYAQGDNLFVHVAQSGDVLQVLALSGEDIDKGELLSAAASGKWVAATTGGVVESLEDTGGALAADTHIRVRVL